MKLKRYGFYRNLIWFGLGIKEVVTDLADTEKGLTLVALCAALSTTYDALFAAKIPRELCVLCKAPQSFTPALRQLEALVKLCAGILTSSRFATLNSGFGRLISGYSPQMAENRCTPATCSALAKAILALARVSKHDLVKATFSGSLDCAWLAAFAQWVLSLDVVIIDSNGSFLYRSTRIVEALPQVTIVLLGGKNGEAQQHLLRSKVSVLSSGQILPQKDPTLQGLSLKNWQGSWSTMFRDVFHDNIHGLLNDSTSAAASAA